MQRSLSNHKKLYRIVILVLASVLLILLVLCVRQSVQDIFKNSQQAERADIIEVGEQKRILQMAVNDTEGMIATHIKDLNNDGILELTAVSLRQEIVRIDVYTIVEGVSVKLKTELPMLYGGISDSGTGNTHVFFFENDGVVRLGVLYANIFGAYQEECIVRVDVFEVTNNILKCKKSITSDFYDIYETTILKIEEIKDFKSGRQMMEIKPGTYEDIQARRAPYSEIYQMEFAPYLDLGDWFAAEYENMAYVESEVPFDFDLGDKMEYVEEAARVRYNPRIDKSGVSKEVYRYDPHN